MVGSPRTGDAAEPEVRSVAHEAAPSSCLSRHTFLVDARQTPVLPTGSTTRSKHPGRCVVLSDHERETLREIQRQLVVNDPDLQRSFRAFEESTPTQTPPPEGRWAHGGWAYT